MPNPHTDYWPPYGHGANADGENEYIELYNAGSTSVDISGWRLWRNGSPFATIASNPATENMPPGGHILLLADDSYANRGGPNITGYRSAVPGSFSLNNTGGYTISLHAAGDEQDSVTLPTPSGGYGDDRPYYRNPAGGNWVYASSSSERATSCCSLSTRLCFT